ncbi:hypothetical protein pb186bvf_003246 [Paramecium bursaria]
MLILSAQNIRQKFCQNTKEYYFLSERFQQKLIERKFLILEIREICGCIKIVIIKNHAQQQDLSILEQLLESQFFLKQMPKTDKQSREPQSHKMKHTQTIVETVRKNEIFENTGYRQNLSLLIMMDHLSTNN